MIKKLKQQESIMSKMILPHYILYLFQVLIFRDCANGLKMQLFAMQLSNNDIHSYYRFFVGVLMDGVCGTSFLFRSLNPNDFAHLKQATLCVCICDSQT